MTFDSVIDALGGTTVVAVKLSASSTVVSNWRTRGIPAKRWPAIVRLARARRVKGVTSERLAEIHEMARGA